MSTTHLWEVDHPYYCNESNHHARGYHTVHETWAEFAEGMGASDMDLNLLFRWDWKKHADDDDGPARDVLQTFWVMQRKGIFCCHEVTVTEADEPVVRSWLAERYHHLLRLWEPIASIETA